MLPIKLQELLNVIKYNYAMPWRTLHLEMLRDQYADSHTGLDNVFVVDKWASKTTRRLVRPAKTQIRLRVRAVWSESSRIACAFYSLRAIKCGMKKKPCHTGWMYRLIWAVAGHTGLIVGYVMRWFIHNCSLLLLTRQRQCKGCIRKTCPFKYIENFTSKKLKIFR